MNTSTSTRLLSLDLFRGVTMFLLVTETSMLLLAELLYRVSKSLSS